MARPRNVFYSLGSWDHWYVKGLGFVPYSSFRGPEADPRVVAAVKRHGASSDRGFRTARRAYLAMAHLALLPGTSPWMTKMSRRGRGREFRDIGCVPPCSPADQERVRKWAVAYLQGRA